MSKELKFISQQVACSGILFIFAVRGTVAVLGTLAVILWCQCIKQTDEVKLTDSYFNKITIFVTWNYILKN
jgi:hypothetical protein